MTDLKHGQKPAFPSPHSGHEHHTPGPWAWSRFRPAEDLPYRCVLESEPARRRDVPNMGPIVELREDHAAWPHAGRTPDYALIASAPDLLVACKMALTLIQNTWIEEHGNPAVGRTWGELERAIAKAQGETTETFR